MCLAAICSDILARLPCVSAGQVIRSKKMRLGLMMEAGPSLCVCGEMRAEDGFHCLLEHFLPVEQRKPLDFLPILSG
jgi:hypothetical protein